MVYSDTPAYYKLYYAFNWNEGSPIIDDYFDSNNLATSLPSPRLNSPLGATWFQQFGLSGSAFSNLRTVFEIQKYGVAYTTYSDPQSGSSSGWYPHLRVTCTNSLITGGGSQEYLLPDLIDEYRSYYGIPAFDWQHWKGVLKTPATDFRVFFEILCAIGRRDPGGTPEGDAGHEGEWAGDTDVIDTYPGFFTAFGTYDWVYWNTMKIPQDTTPTGAWWRSISGDSG